VNGNALARDVFQTGLSRESDMDFEPGLLRSTRKPYSVLQEFVDLATNEEYPWYVFNWPHEGVLA
jgi:hypothetical protein